MIYTILVAHVADPLPPLASLAGLALNLSGFTWSRLEPGSGLLMYEGFNSLSVTERIRYHYKCIKSNP